jgi:hypothetical protein
VNTETCHSWDLLKERQELNRETMFFTRRSSERCPGAQVRSLQSLNARCRTDPWNVMQKIEMHCHDAMVLILPRIWSFTGDKPVSLHATKLRMHCSCKDESRAMTLLSYILHCNDRPQLRPLTAQLHG